MPTSQNASLTPTGNVPASPPGKQRLPYLVWMLGVVTFVLGTTELVLVGLLPQVSESFDISIAQAGSLITIFALGMVFGSPILAIATLRFSRRTTLIAALVVFAVAHVAVAATDVFAVVVVARLMAALCVGTFWAVGSGIAAAAAGPAAATKAMSVMQGGFTLATVIGVPLGAAVGQLLGWRGPFWALAVISAACVVLLWKVLPRDTGSVARPSVQSELRRLRSGRLWITYVASGLVLASYIGVYTFISPQLTDRAGLAEGIVPVVMIGYGIGAVAGTVAGGRFGDRKPYTLLGGALIGLALTLAALFLWGDNPAVAIIAFTVISFFGFTTGPVLVTMALQAGGTDGVLPMALSNSFFNVGVAVGSAVAGIAISSPAGEQGIPAAGLILVAAAAVPCIGLAVGGRRAAAQTRPS